MIQKAVKIDITQHEALARIAKETGIPMAEQVRRALIKWIKNHERFTAADS